MTSPEIRNRVAVASFRHEHFIVIVPPLTTHEKAWLDRKGLPTSGRTIVSNKTPYSLIAVASTLDEGDYSARSLTRSTAVAVAKELESIRGEKVLIEQEPVNLSLGPATYLEPKKNIIRMQRGSTA